MDTNVLLIKKQNYVGIRLTGKEKDHNDVRYRGLCAMRIDSPVQNKFSVDAKGDKNHMIVLDEAIETLISTRISLLLAKTRDCVHFTHQMLQ